MIWRSRHDDLGCKFIYDDLEMQEYDSLRYVDEQFGRWTCQALVIHTDLSIKERRYAREGNYPVPIFRYLALHKSGRG